jgi:hypothetical protein
MRSIGFRDFFQKARLALKFFADVFVAKFGPFMSKVVSIGREFCKL